jgi:hypothetical protein
VVGGYVRKRVTLRISKGLRAVALAAGISRRVYSDTRVIFIAIYIALAEKIGTPLIKNLLAAGVPWTGIMRRRNRLGAPILRQPRASDARIRAGRRFSCSRRTQGTWAGAENRCSAVEARHKDAGRTKKMGSCPVSIGVDLPPIFL